MFEGKKTISRELNIFFLNDVIKGGVLDYKERSGKSGYHKVYYPKMSGEQFEKYVTVKITTGSRVLIVLS